MSSRIVPLSALSVMLLVIFWAVVATAQQVGPGGSLPVEQQTLPITPEQAAQAVPVQFQAPGQGAQPGAVLQPIAVQPALPAQAPEFQPLPQAPFVLTPQEAAVVDRVLDDWQRISSQVKTLKARFRRFDYDGVFGDANTPKRMVDGTIRYAAPDKGFYALDDESEKWICTGQSIFEFRSSDRKVREWRLPPQLQGQAISDGPMPFVFGVDKEKTKARYWVRLIPGAGSPGEVWLEAYPRMAKDAANYRKVDVILTFTVGADGTVTDLQPKAINQHLPNGKERTAYAFSEMSINNGLDKLQNGLDFFVRPSTPLGWSHELVDDGATAPPEGTPPGTPASGIGAAPTGGTVR